jgi:hypothetical protein
LRKEHRVLMKIYGPKREDVTGEWGRLHNEQLYNLYCSPNIIRVIKLRIMRRARHVARMRGAEVYIYIWKDDIKRDVQAVGWDMDWVDLVQD